MKVVIEKHGKKTCDYGLEPQFGTPLPSEREFIRRSARQKLFSIKELF